MVLDCMIDGSVFRNEDGSYAEGATPGIVENGFAYALVNSGGTWRMDSYNEEVAACAGW